MKKYFYSILLSLLFSQGSFSQEKILLIGDSHLAGIFGDKLDQLFRTIDKAQVKSIGSCGSQASSWYNNWKTPCGYVQRSFEGNRTSSSSFPTPLVKNLLEKDRPTLTIVVLGTNNLAASDFSRDLSVVKKMIIDINESGSECAWIGAPHVRFVSDKKQEDFNQKLEEILNQNHCFFVNSYSFTKYPQSGGDGIHYSYFKDQAFQWAQKSFELIIENYRLAVLKNNNK